MTDRETIELARDTRRAQRRYFKTRDRDDLDAAKALEDRLDAALGLTRDAKRPAPAGPLLPGMEDAPAGPYGGGGA